MPWKLFMLLHALSPLARGDYTLRAQVHSYDNPSNFCAECEVCCDTPSSETSCDGVGLRCDNSFFSCVRPLGTPTQTLDTLVDTVESSTEDRAGALQCTEPLAAFRSETNYDGGSIDFSMSMFLGIPNPMEFRVSANKWQGIQFYLDVVDRDLIPGNTDDVVESFVLDISPRNLSADRGMTEVITRLGIFSVANIELSFEVVCLPEFVGETCINISQICSTDPCSNNGTCLQSGSGFICACRGDFTGETYETRINDCQDVNCNGGTCVDGVQSFTCQCEEGFTGGFCEQRNITTTTVGGTSATTVHGW